MAHTGRWKVLVAEDDALYRAHLASAIPWERLNLALVGVMPNGQRALDIIIRRPIDILITDVEMPGMSGVDLVRQARAVRPELHCVILSNFDTFEYVKAGFHGGADDYLLKHRANSEALTEVLEKIVVQLTRMHAGGGDAAGDDPWGFNSMMRRDVVRALLTGAVEGHRREAAAAAAFPALAQEDRRSFGMVCLSMLHFREHLASLGPDTTPAHYTTTFLDLMQDAFGERCVIAQVRDNEFGLLLASGARGSRTLSVQLQAVIEQAVMLAQKFFGVELVMVQHRGVVGLPELDSRWSELSTQLSARRFEGPHGGVDGGAGVGAGVGVGAGAGGGAGVGVNAAPLLDLPQEQSLFRLITTGDSTTVAATVRAVFDSALAAGATRSALLILGSDLINLGIRVCKNRGIPPDVLFTEAQAPAEVLAAAETASELRDYVTQRLVELSCRFSSEGAGHPLVERAVSVIHRRYAEPLTLSGLAAELGVSPSHLSRTLTAGLGHGFSEELSRARLAAAQTLLLDVRLGIKQVARRCGYSSYTYFFDVFRKHTGMTPQRYRAQQISSAYEQE